MGALAKKPMKSLNELHDAMMLWLIANPGRPEREMADELGYTQAWLSTVKNSDMFQAKFRELRKEHTDAVVHGISEKLTATAELALERTMERLDAEAAPTDNFLVQTTANTLKALGYGQKAEPSRHEHLHLHASQEAILAARERAQAQRPRVVQAKEGEGSQAHRNLALETA